MRRALAAVLLAGLLPAGAARAAPCPMPAAAFLDTIGVNTHLIWEDTAYGDFALVRASLAALGVRHVRDTLFNNPVLLDRIRTLGGDGVRFDLFVNGEAGEAVNGLDWQVREMARLAPFVAAVEGPNETDNWPVAWQGLTGLDATRAVMAALRDAMAAEPALAGVPLIQTSFGSPDAYRAFGDGTALADVANAHSYASHGDPPGEAAPARAAEARGVTRTDRVISTEAGYHTATDLRRGWVGLPPRLHAAYVTRLLLEQARIGVERTYLYELLDGDSAGPLDDPEAHFGLFLTDGTPKPAATAIGALTRLLRPEDGPPAPPAAPDATLDASADVHDLLVQTGEGTYAWVVWAEVPGWDALRGRPRAVEPVPAMLRFGAAARGSVHDLLAPEGAPPVGFAGETLALAVPDHPLVVRFTLPAGAVDAAACPPP